MYLVEFKLPSVQPIPGTERLFYRLKGGAEAVGDTICLPPNGSLSLDTFFNILSFKYLKLVDTSRLRVAIVYRGAVSVSLCMSSAEGNIVVSCTELSSPDKATAYIEVPNVDVREGFFYIALQAREQSVFYGGGFTVDNTPRHVKVGIVVCTYRREEFVIRNMREIHAYLKSNPELAARIGVFVVDNGRTLTTEAMPETVKLIPNDNTGGAGGFTRGLREVLNCSDEYSHFLFMDDDIVLMPSVLDRTVNLLAAFSPECAEYSIGGAMLKLTKPTIQHEMGGRWLGNSLWGNGRHVDVAMPDGLLINEKEAVADYNAWWFTCMPISLVHKHGLPLEKLFIKCDDVEYGLRAMEGLVNVNGIAVWHEDFDSKFSPALEYFIKRNELIVNSRFSCGRGFWANWAKMVRAIAKALVEFRYFHIELIERAYADFLKGADYVANIDYTDFFAEIKDILPKMKPIGELTELYGIENPDVARNKSLNAETKKFIEIATLNGYLLPKSTYHRVSVVDMVYPKPINFYRTETIVNYNPYSKQGFVTEIKKSKLFFGLAAIIRSTLRMIFRYHEACNTFRKM